MAAVLDCIFCKIVKGDIPSFKLFESENVMAFLGEFHDYRLT